MWGIFSLRFRMNLLWIRFSVDTPTEVVLNHFTPHSLHTPSQRHLYFGKNLVYELHLGTKTLTRYCDHRASFNGICCPPLISYLWGNTLKWKY